MLSDNLTTRPKRYTLERLVRELSMAMARQGIKSIIEADGSGTARVCVNIQLYN